MVVVVVLRCDEVVFDGQQQVLALVVQVWLGCPLSNKLWPRLIPGHFCLELPKI